MTRAVTAGVIEPRERPRQFGKGLHQLLQERGMAVYFSSVGASHVDLARAVRETPADTAVIFIQYAPGWFGVLPLVLAVLRWRMAGRWVVLCRVKAPFDRLRQRVAYEVLRRIAGAEILIDHPDDASIVGTEVPERTLRQWPADRLPPPHHLASGWRARRGPAPLEEILDLLRCPRCAVALRAEGSDLVCESGHRYPVVDEIPVLLPERVDLDLERHAEEHPAGDAYGAGSHAGWHELGYYKRDLVARLLRQAPVPRASLDVGCGDWGVHHAIAGSIGRELAVAGDISLDLVRHARNAATAPGRIHHLVFSAEAIPFRDGIFDLTYCSEVLEHLVRPETAIAEMRRTSARGRAILTVPNETVTGKLEKDHVQTFGYDAFQDLVRRHFEVERTHGVYLFAERDIDALPRSVWGRLRMALYLGLGRYFPARSVNVIVDGRFRA
jgi:SAM-dependent methyltransferase